MDRGRFARLRLAVQENAVPADPRQAAELEDRLLRQLESSGLFDRVEVGRTDNPDGLVIALCRCAQDVRPWAAAHRLERLWLAVGEPEWEAHVVMATETLLDFEGALTLDDGRHYLTVRVVAEGRRLADSSA